MVRFYYFTVPYAMGFYNMHVDTRAVSYTHLTLPTKA